MRWLLAVLATLLLGLAALFTVLPDTPPEPEPTPVPVEVPAEPEVERPVRRRVEPAHAEPPREEPQPADEGKERVLRVVDGEDRPIQGVPISPFFSATVYTDAAGEISFTEADFQHELTVPLIDESVSLHGPLTILRIPDLHPVEARLVDLETGMPLTVEWPEGSEGPERAGWVRPGKSVSLHLPIRVPDGWAWPETYRSQWLGSASRYADRFVATIAVPREVPLTVRVTRHDGSPAVRASVTAFTAGVAQRAGATVTADEQGIARVTGLPFRRREGVRIVAEWSEDFETYRTVQRVRLADSNVPVESALALPPEPIDMFEGPGSSSTIGVGGSATETPEGPFTAGLRVQVVRRDGSPGSGAAVHTFGAGHREGRADHEGVLILEDLPAAELEILVLESGIVPTRAAVKLVAGKQSDVVLRERAGRAVTVRVVDERGVALPGAEVSVIDEYLWHWSHAHIVHGAQQLQLLTDVSGGCRLANVPPDGIAIRAIYGSRSVEAIPGASDTLELTMPDTDPR